MDMETKKFLPFKKCDDGDVVVFPNVRLWTRSQKKIWISIFFISGAMVYASRTAMPVCAVSITQEFNWTKSQTGLVLSAFFWGYVTTQVAGGHLADKHGGEYIISVSLVGWALLTLVTPFIVRSVPPASALLYAVIARVLTGCFQGVYYPSLSSLFSRRVSELDRAFSYSFATSGSHIGTLFSGIVGSLTNEYFGWPITFIFIGTLSFFLFLIYHFFVMSLSPDRPTPPKNSEPPSLSWCLLFRKAPFWAIVIGNFCSGWMFFILLSWLPTYFQENFPNSKSWVYNAVPWLFCPPSQWTSGLLADHLISKGYSTTFVRKFSQTIAFLGSSFSLFLMCHTESYYPALLCMTLAINFSCFHHAGISVNVQDIAPTYAGAVFGFMNMAGAAPGFIGVYVTGFILDTTKSWTIVFSLTIAILIVGWLIFLIFGTGKKVI